MTSETPPPYAVHMPNFLKDFEEVSMWEAFSFWTQVVINWREGHTWKKPIKLYSDNFFIPHT